MKELPRQTCVLFSLLLLLVPHFQRTAYAQIKPVYAIFSPEGKPTSYKKLIKSLSNAEVIFFGELHDNPIAHWLELQLLQDLYAANNKLILGLEMFEADDQIVLNEYLTGMIAEKNFLSEAKAWDNYKTDYRPLVEFAREKRLPVVATNVPRRYANMVYRKGLQSLDSLGAESLEWIAPLPLEVDYSLSGYKAMLDGMGQHGNGSGRNLAASQALKDATMAHFISTTLRSDGVFYHINGAYHSQDYQGIVTYLKKYRPDINVVTIHVAEQSSLDSLESVNMNKADYTICITADMIKTY